ncbi:phage portal protein, partial [Citrobacter freundii]|nr:phage portal protein [Citrobacter freundii]
MKKSKKSYNRQPATSRDLSDALRSAPSLSAFSFDGPYRAESYDLLDNMYCADNGRYFETP